MPSATPTTLRDQLIQELTQDLIGPHEPAEQLTDRPTVQYLAGILYPSGTSVSDDENDSLQTGSADDDGGSNPEMMPLTQTMNPSSIGMTFAVDASVAVVHVAVSYGLYSEIPGGTTASGSKLSNWVRQPVSETITIPLNPGNARQALPGGAQVGWVVRPGTNEKSVTVFLLNNNPITPDIQPDDTECLFQPYLRATGPDGTRPFVHRQPQGNVPIDPDLESYRLLYRACYDFAAGHGCATDWHDVQDGRAGVLETALIPRYDLAATLPNSMPDLDMKALGEAKAAADVLARLTPMLDAYAAWIDDRQHEVATLAPALQSAASVHVDRCRDALQRMREGLSLIGTDKHVFESFRFANQAMLLQRSFGQWAQEYRRTGKRTTTKPIVFEGIWRPFQMAFILLNLPGIANPDHADRSMVDLLWFPTGGGKTEAYLGLTAFTIALRRLRKTINGMRGDGGVTVIMRYTLRLLTTQQFQRAATLICACEYLRRKDQTTWGKEPISIGLWVGNNATPNMIKGDGGAQEALEKLRDGKDVHEGNPLQLQSCPWCGESLSAFNYHIDPTAERMVIVCPRSGCQFYGTSKDLQRGIPALLVDDDIYHYCPTLLIATVDKFARLPWKPQTMALFGKVDRYCSDHGYLTHTDNHAASHRKGRGVMVAVETCQPFLPPELIIQDELHLISGPLGTLSGLYETAIDMLCSRSSKSQTLIRPKIVASTATIRRAQDQVQSLFARTVQLFPPSGLDAGDSFFASEQPLDKYPGRSYVGVFAPGRSVKTALVRAYAILLQVSGEQLATYGVDAADAYSTLIGYFNSLRELGGALRLVEDDIVQRIEYLSKQRGTARRSINTENVELTSRIPSRKIPEILKLLEQSAGQQGAIDVLLATNMISVGVDVSRLGLMIVNGQPKASAEYIQATSRVGRQRNAPGLVVTVYNWSRPRDSSHYERFRTYHQAIYRHVEATSVTPFAPRSRDKALHAVMIALARMLRENWAANNAAGLFDRNHPTTGRIVKWLKDRVAAVDSSVLPEVEAQIDELFDWWKGQVDLHASNLRYQSNPFQSNDSAPVLMHPAEQAGKTASRATLNSLREVEGESQLYITWV